MQEMPVEVASDSVEVSRFHPHGTVGPKSRTKKIILVYRNLKYLTDCRKSRRSLVLSNAPLPISKGVIFQSSFFIVVQKLKFYSKENRYN